MAMSVRVSIFAPLKALWSARANSGFTILSAAMRKLALEQNFSKIHCTRHIEYAGKKFSGATGRKKRLKPITSRFKTGRLRHRRFFTFNRRAYNIAPIHKITLM